MKAWSSQLSPNDLQVKTKKSLGAIIILTLKLSLLTHCVPHFSSPPLSLQPGFVGPTYPQAPLITTNHFASAENKVRARLVWRIDFTDARFGSPGSTDLNGDGVLDIVMGGGKEQGQYKREIVAINGASGQRLWTHEVKSRVFASPLFIDINQDSIPDVILGLTNNIQGCEVLNTKTQDVIALDGTDGTLIWSLEQVNAARPLGIEIGEGNFGTPVMTSDIDQDGFKDIVVIHSGGNVQSRPAAKIFVISAQNGYIIEVFESHDRAEAYSTPSINSFASPTRLILGTGGETLPGSISEIEINNHQLIWSVKSKQLGFISSPTIYQGKDNRIQVIVNSFNATTYKIDANSGQVVWTHTNPGSQTYSSPVVGHFNEDGVLDVFTQYSLGVFPRYTKNVQVWLDGKTGQLIHSHAHNRAGSASPSVIDIDHDGFDEILSTATSGPFGDQSHLILFDGRTHAPLFEIEFSKATAVTPIVADIDNNKQLDIITGFGDNIVRFELETPKEPIVKWGTFRGENANGTLTQNH